MRKQEKFKPLNFLYLDTSNPSATKLVLFDDEGKILLNDSWQSERNQTEELLERLDAALKKVKIYKDEFDVIFVNPGPGSYTGLRVGITTANLLAFSLNKPIFAARNENEALAKGKNLGRDISFLGFISPNYPNPPKITEKKSRLR